MFLKFYGVIRFLTLLKKKETNAIPICNQSHLQKYRNNVFQSISDCFSCSSKCTHTAHVQFQTSEAGSKSLVYCVAGVSRSASLCIAYLMRHCGLTLLEAYNHVKDRRPRIKPNCSFFRQLIEYEEQLRSLQTVSMVFCDAVQMEIPSVYESDYKFACPFRKKLGERNGRY